MSLLQTAIFAFLAAACGNDAGTEPKARILPVDGLPVQGLSLAEPQGRCVALRAFVEGFSTQHAGKTFRGLQCSDDAATGQLTLQLDFRKDGSDAGGSAIVRRAGTAAPFEFFVCRIVRKAGQGPASSCSGVAGGAKGKGIPKEWRKTPFQLDDFVYSLQDFVAR